MSESTQALFDFIKNSPTAYHAVQTVRERLLSEGYTELSERDSWQLCDGGKYFTTRNGSSLIAFRANDSASGYTVVASHSDSPSFRVKSSGESMLGEYTRLPVERYGGMIYHSWLDRPLSIAGRVVIRTPDGVRTENVNVDRDLLVIPSLAIHFDRTVNEKCSLNPAVDLIPLMGATGERISLAQLLASELNVKAEDILYHDLFLYVRAEGVCLGASSDIIVAPRLDDLECVFASVEAFLASNNDASIPVLAIFDNEEVGSSTKQGAASTFLEDTLRRISVTEERHRVRVASSFMVSADNAHAKHPNHPEISDAQNAPVLNGGVVIKHNANQRYTTDSISAAIFKTVCERAGVAVQNFYNRADITGGTTLGSIANTKVSMSTVDVGLPQLAMHAAVETAGALDLDYMIGALSRLYSSEIAVKCDEIIIK